MPFRVVRVGGVRHVPGYHHEIVNRREVSRSPLAATTIRSNVVSRRSDWAPWSEVGRPPRDRTAPAPRNSSGSAAGTPRGPRNTCPWLSSAALDSSSSTPISADGHRSYASSGRSTTDQTVGSRRGRRHSRGTDASLPVPHTRVDVSLRVNLTAVRSSGDGWQAAAPLGLALSTRTNRCAALPVRPHGRAPTACR